MSAKIARALSGFLLSQGKTVFIAAITAACLGRSDVSIPLAVTTASFVIIGWLLHVYAIAMEQVEAEAEASSSIAEAMDELDTDAIVESVFNKEE